MTTVSVVVPTFNNAAHVDATIESVLGQSFDDFELIISDHSSVDATWEIVQEYRTDPRVTVHRVGPGGGAGRNWNHVTGLAQGRFVKLVCGDDLLAPTCLERQVRALRDAGEGAVMVAARRDVIDSAGRTILRGRGLSGLTGRTPAAEVVRRTARAGTNVLGEPACVMIRREVLEAVGGWHGQDGYVIDLRTYLRVLEQGDLVALPETLAAFRVSRQQWSVRLQRDQARQMSTLLEEVADRWPGAVSGRDLALGRGRARLSAWQRRVFYRLWSRRL